MIVGIIIADQFPSVNTHRLQCPVRAAKVSTHKQRVAARSNEIFKLPAFVFSLAQYQVHRVPFGQVLGLKHERM